MGDFNIDLLKSEENRHVNDFLNQMFSSSFYPLIPRPTRVTKSSATLTDNIYVNYVEENYKSGLLFSDLSDHLPVFQITNRITNDSKPLIRTGCRQINKNTVQRLLENLEKENWHDVYESQNTHEAYNTFYDKLYNIYDKCIPYKNHKIAENGKIQRITKGILISRKTKKKRLYKKFLAKPTIVNKTNYKKYQNKFNKIKKAANKIYYDNTFFECKGNLKTTWSLINEIINRR